MTNSNLHLFHSKSRAVIDGLKTSIRCMLFLFDLSQDALKGILPLSRLSARLL
jgi:hypothetical protein